MIVGPDGARLDHRRRPERDRARRSGDARRASVWPLPADTGYANLNTLTFDRKGRVWFTGQSGYYGRLDPATGDMKVWKAPRGSGPYGITTTPGGDVYYASLAGNHIARIDVETGEATVIEPPTQGPGRAPRVVRFARADLGQLLEHRPGRHVRSRDASAWREWKLPGNRARVFGVGRRHGQGVADRLEHQRDRPLRSGHREVRELSVEPRAGANVRQMLGRAGEAWGAESGIDRLVMVPAPAP